MKPLLRKLNILLCFFCVMTIVAQKTEIQANFDAEFHHALKLYNNKAYAGAQKQFIAISEKANRYENIKTDADYYDAMCAIKLNQSNADEKVIAFTKMHPYSSKKERIFLNIGNYYFVNRKASHALKWYKRVNPAQLNLKDREELDYKMGYTLLVSNYLSDAKARFEKLLGNPLYGNDARYFYGYISYKQENYGEAEDNLSALADDITYKAKANYYLLDMAFKSGRFEKAVKIGEQIYSNVDKKLKSDVIKIIGESYFNIGNYEEAIPNLVQYKGKDGKWNNTDYYYLGYAYYKQGDYEAALKNFNKIIDGNNKVAQNAYYHLGHCYLKTDKKSEALNAFRNAAEMDFDEQIRVDADLNYAKLSYEAGNPYKSTPEVLKDFLEKYPTSPDAPEIKNLLITSYLHQQDYQGAIDYLDQNRSPNNNLLANEVSLYRGIQLFHEQKYAKANPHFLIACDAYNDTIRNKARYWMAETDYLLGKYQNALDEYLSVKNKNVSEAKNLNYNIAYSHFKLKQYHKAGRYFTIFLNQKIDDNDLNDDAYNRLGDCYYATKEYDKAILAYKSVIDQGGAGSDYALYQKAISNGLAGNKTDKIKDLEELATNYTSSALVDDALFQLASTHSSSGNSTKANNAYNNLLDQFPKSSYVPSTLLRQGLLSYNNGNNNEALSKFKTIVDKYPNSNEAKQAVANTRNVYVDIGKVDEYANWVKGVSSINVSDSDIDNTTYEAAENKFLSGNSDRAIAGFNNYIAKFPNGLNALKANFYLAQSYFKINQKNKAIPHYTFVADKEKNEFTEEALAKLSQLYLEQENWTKGITLLQKLEKEANYPQNLLFAESNLMKGYFEKEDYENAKLYAEKVLYKDKLAPDVQEDARMILARSAIKTKDFITAEEYYNVLDDTATGELKAECLYYKAFFLHEAELYDDSNKEIQSLIANYSSYKYWGVKSYIVMAKNYYALKDAYQATYILESVVKNFPQYRDLLEEANNELSKIKSKEFKTNESVKASE